VVSTFGRGEDELVGIMLMIGSGHTQAAAYLIGATAAEKLIEEYQL
jgi:hypothetical protein